MGINETYGTSDLYVASWLLSKGLELLDIDRHNKQRSNFIFQDRLDRPELVRQFVCGSATGNVVDFANQIFCEGETQSNYGWTYKEELRPKRKERG